jgi:hypothetical protein
MDCSYVQERVLLSAEGRNALRDRLAGVGMGWCGSGVRSRLGSFIIHEKPTIFHTELESVGTHLTFESRLPNPGPALAMDCRVSPANAQAAAAS